MPGRDGTAPYCEVLYKSVAAPPPEPGDHMPVTTVSRGWREIAGNLTVVHVMAPIGNKYKALLESSNFLKDDICVNDKHWL